jgi:hypothetical protein
LNSGARRARLVARRSGWQWRQSEPGDHLSDALVIRADHKPHVLRIELSRARANEVGEQHSQLAPLGVVLPSWLVSHWGPMAPLRQPKRCRDRGSRAALRNWVDARNSAQQRYHAGFFSMGRAPLLLQSKTHHSVIGQLQNFAAGSSQRGFLFLLYLHLARKSG